MPIFVNRRNAPRRAADAFVKVRSTKGGEWMLRTRDVSATGLFVYPRSAGAEFAVGDALRLELYDYDRYLTCRGVVVRKSASDEIASYPGGFGVHITEISETDRAALNQMASAS